MRIQNLSLGTGLSVVFLGALALVVFGVVVMAVTMDTAVAVCAAVALGPLLGKGLFRVFFSVQSQEVVAHA